MSARSYSAAHRRKRAMLLPYAYGMACPMCGYPMREGQALDLDHSVPRILGGGDVGDRMCHASCNRSSGASLGNRMRGNRSSRDW